MWRFLRPQTLLQNKKLEVQVIRCLQTLHKDCILRTQPWLINEPCYLLRRFPALVETTSGFCTKDGEETPESPKVKMAPQFGEEDIKRLFQKNPKIQAEIIAKIIQEYKYYDKNTMLEMADVREHYLLTDRDLETLKKHRRKTPYSSRELKGQKFIYLFYKHEVEKLALKKYGTMDIIKQLKKNKEAEEKKLSVKMKHFYLVSKSAIMGKESISTGGVVLFAFTVNFCIFLFKLVIYMKTGSSVVFAETVHSFVDVLNQFILVIGQVISKYPADDKFPYGHRNYLYISSLGSGGFIFAFGFMATMLFGVFNGFLAAPAVITADTLNLSLKILIGSGIAEFVSLVYALYKYYNDAKASNMPLMKCIQEGDDPLAKVVIMEDSASVLGTLVCAVAMTGQYYFGCIYGFPVCDMLGNLIITGMLGYVSKILLSANSEKLVGKSLWYEDDIKHDIERYRYVNGVFDIKSIDQDEDSRFKAEVELDAKEIARVIFETSADQDELLKLMQGLTETEAAKVLFVNYSQKFYYEIVKFIDDMEEDLKKKYPEIRHIDIEISGGELPEEKKVGSPGQIIK